MPMRGLPEGIRGTRRGARDEGYALLQEYEAHYGEGGEAMSMARDRPLLKLVLLGLPE